MDKSEKIEAYYGEEHHFKKAIEILRNLALKTNLEETYKWNFPTYTLDGKNVLSICKFKQHFGIWFFNGVFLSDRKKVLQNAQEGKTQAMRHWKFNSIQEIDEKSVLAYINEAIENQKKGIQLNSKKKAPVSFTIPVELKKALKNDLHAQKSFKKLAPYNQKEYIEYIASAKQNKTKKSRLEKILPMIKKGEGLNDKYK
ncbi:YdeI/OmpD-associated family protein [Maribacter aestuarii]|uniref:YdeI/OmpD-associated family protein n=1 Tax=Maribacter aestuarii TaxID=1130723 RepID=UPI00248B48BD|nr:YdeI/OmpD-associated family protein [Maribacter aestuarii]